MDTPSEVMHRPITNYLKRILFFGAVIILLFTVGCEKRSPLLQAQRSPQSGFCNLPNETLQKYLIAINIIGQSSSSGVATILGRQLYILTNRHNLPDEPILENIEFRNHQFEYTKARSIILLGKDFAEEQGLGVARDFAILTPSNPSLFLPLPLSLDRHQGEVIVPSYANRLFTVGRGTQWFTDERFDQLDFNLAPGASGSPVVNCYGQIVGLYTALIHPEDARHIGFRGISTPITTIIQSLMSE
jgi:hypothetical protein